MRWFMVASLAFVQVAQADSKCSVRKVAMKAPSLVVVADVEAARKRLLTGSTAMENEADIIAADTPAFVASVRRSYLHGSSSSRWDSSAVFVLDKRVVIAPKLVTWGLSLPPECSMHLQDKILDVRLVTRGKRQLGLVRVRRVDSKDKPTLGSVAATTTEPACAKTTTYRIEDHVIDLDKRREILVVTGAYVGPVYEEHDPPLATPELTKTSLAVADAACGEFALRP